MECARNDIGTNERTYTEDEWLSVRYKCRRNCLRNRNKTIKEDTVLICGILSKHKQLSKNSSLKKWTRRRFHTKLTLKTWRPQRQTYALDHITTCLLLEVAFEAAGGHLTANMHE